MIAPLPATNAAEDTGGKVYCTIGGATRGSVVRWQTFCTIITRATRHLRVPWVACVITLALAFPGHTSRTCAAERQGLGTLPASATSSMQTGQRAKNAGTADPVEEGLSQKPVEIAHPFGFPITNSMVVMWVAAAGLIGFAQLATRHMKLVPHGAQNLWEWLVEGLHTFLEGIIGRHLVDRTFWYFASTFIFILFANWVGLIPGVGTIGWGHAGPAGFIVTEPLFRGANADLNLTLAMALIFFACWFVWALAEVGMGGFLKELFAPKGESQGLLKVLLAVVFLVVGCLEVISILFRPVSLSFRLYGNTFAGEKMLETMARVVPGLAWLIPVPFYFLELLVGLVQALVFMLLTAVFTLLICQHDESPSAGAHP